MNIALWLTDPARKVLLQRQDVLPAPEHASGEYPVIEINDTKTYQTIEGFGFSLTGASALLIASLDEATRDALLHELFAPHGDGIRVSFLRLSIGASDLSERCFTYDDLPPGDSDFDLARFDLLAGDAQVIPLLQEILAINPELSIMASPWTAPPWMKTNQRFVAGRLRPDCYEVYARYFVKYLEGMRAQGIQIRAVTVQNEPSNYKNEPSMVMLSNEQADFIGHHLGPALQEAGLPVEIFCWDHNCDLPDYPLRILDDPDANLFTAGVAWHLYGGEIEILSRIHEVHPDKKMYFTEQWVGADGQFAPDLKWHLRKVLIGSLRNWSEVVLEWNLASDPFCGPHTPGGESGCVGALTIADTVVRNVAYYIIGHAAKFVPPGSRRIESSLAGSLYNVALKTPNGQIVLIVENDAEHAQTFGIRFNGQQIDTVMHAGSVGTYVW
jgi:glucosylceramidase